MPIHLRQNPYNGVNAHLHSSDVASLSTTSNYPVRFETYSTDDQGRILARMKAIKEGQPTT